MREGERERERGRVIKREREGWRKRERTWERAIELERKKRGREGQRERKEE